MTQGTFFAKLCELEQDYEMMHTCLGQCQSMDARALHEQLQRARQAYEASSQRLDDCLKRCHSPAMAALAQTQKNYYEAMEKLTRQELPAYFQSPLGDNQSEACSLYAEYDIDFARQAICHAVISVLSAMEMETINTEAQKEEPQS